MANSENDLINDPNGGMPRLIEIMRRLRDPNTGCPWDIEQNFASIAPYTIEEAYEVADAIDRKNWPELEGELGDLLFQSIFHAQMANDAGYFDFDDVVKNIADKMVARHPHVFGAESRNKTPEQQTKDWESIKAAERAEKSEKGVLGGVALGLPALMRAQKLQNRAARVGFDWPDISLVIDKVIEEANELSQAQNQSEVVEEFGDLLFTIVNLGRRLDIDVETALRATNAKFVQRFEYIETQLAKDGQTPEQTDLSTLETLWNKAKKQNSKV